MRKVSNSSRKIEKFLLKSFAHYRSGLLRALNIEIEGKRYLGEKMSDVDYKDGVLKFSYGDEKLEVKLEELGQYRRLRTKKYCFYKGAKKKAKKVAKKVAKKASKKAAKKTSKKNSDANDEPTKEDDKE